MSSTNTLPRPGDLKVSQINQDFHLTWLPPYPPTGIVSYYKIRWKPIGNVQLSFILKVQSLN